MRANTKDNVEGTMNQVGGTIKEAVESHLHLPDAPGSRAGSSRRLPQVRHGAGTEDGDAGTDDEENAELHDMTRRFWIGAALTLPVFVLAMAHLIPAPASPGRWPRFALDSICAHHARGLVGGLAVLPPWLALRRHAEFEHVHADRHRRGRGLRLQRRGDARCPACSRTRCNTTARSPSTSRPPR
jgi:hypothetical protein